MDEQRRYNKVRRSLNQRQTLLGMEKPLAVPLGVAALQVGILAMQIWFLPIVWVIRAGFVYMGKREPFYWDILGKYSKQYHRYDPWSDVVVKRNRRPNGFGQKLLK